MGTANLRCERCGNEGEPGFDATKLYVHKVVLDGEGLVEQARIQCEVEGSEEDLACRGCGAPVDFASAHAARALVPNGAVEAEIPYETWVGRMLAKLGGGEYPEGTPLSILEKAFLAFLRPAGEESGVLPSFVTTEPDTRGEEETRARRLLEALYSQLWRAGEGIVYAHIDDGEGMVFVVDFGGDVGRGPARLVHYLPLDVLGLAVGDGAGLRGLYENVRRSREDGHAVFGA